jgi:hypothetical protein
MKFKDIKIGQGFTITEDIDEYQPFWYKVSENEAYQTVGLGAGLREEINPDEVYELTSETFNVNDEPAELEITALTLLKSTFKSHPSLICWVEAIWGNTDEMRDLDNFVLEYQMTEDESPEFFGKTLNILLKDMGYIAPTEKYDLDNSTYMAIFDRRPGGKDQSRNWQANRDKQTLLLANEVIKYRIRGRVNESINTINGMSSPLLAVQSSLGAKIVEYHDAMMNIMRMRISDIKNTILDAKNKVLDM